MKAQIYIKGVIGNKDGQFGLKNVISQYKAYEDPTSAEFTIDSVGGSVEVGESIVKFIEGLDIPTVTIATKAYSIAAHIFMAGDTRLVEDTERPLMIHLPLIPEFTGRSEDFKAAGDYLAKEEKKFTEFYAAKVDLDKDTIYSLLSQETFISGQEAVTMGFATGIKEEKLEAVAFYNEKEQKEEKHMSNITKTLTAIAEKLGINPKEKAVALVLKDANGTDIDFVDLVEGDTPSVGDKAEIDGAPAEGEYVAINGDTWVFSEGKLAEIKKEEEEEEEAPEAVAEEITEVSKWEISVVQEVSEIELGTKIEYKPADEEGEPTSVGAGEYQLSDGRTILTDSEGIVRYIKEAPAQEEPEQEVEANAEEDVDELIDKIVEGLSAKFESKLGEIQEKHENEIKELKKLMGSKDLKVEAQYQPPKTKDKKVRNYLQ